jgi:hypothetical protein
MTRLPAVFAALLLAALPAPSHARAGEAPPLDLHYVAYVAGFHVIYLDVTADLRPDGYRLDTEYRTAGVYGALFSGDVHSDVQGDWAGLLPRPRRFAASGVWHGGPRRTLIDYVDDQPLVRALAPPNEAERAPVPPAEQRDTIDTLSAVIRLIRQVNATGRCDGEARVFDGRRLSRIVVRTAGEETLAPDSRSSFAGPTLRCDFEGRQLGGFMLDEDEAEMRKPHLSTAWLARPRPDLPIVLVRLVFEVHWFGHATMYLTAAAPEQLGEQSDPAVGAGALGAISGPARPQQTLAGH